MALEAALAAVRGREQAEGLLGRFNEQNKAIFKFEPSDEEKRKNKIEEEFTRRLRYASWCIATFVIICAHPMTVSNLYCPPGYLHFLKASRY